MFRGGRISLHTAIELWLLLHRFWLNFFDFFNYASQGSQSFQITWIILGAAEFLRSSWTAWISSSEGIFQNLRIENERWRFGEHFLVQLSRCNSMSISFKLLFVFLLIWLHFLLCGDIFGNPSLSTRQLIQFFLDVSNVVQAVHLKSNSVLSLQLWHTSLSKIEQILLLLLP